MTDGTMMGNLAAGGGQHHEEEAGSTNARALWTVAVIIQTIFAFQVLGVFDLIGISFNPTALFAMQLIAYTVLSFWAFFIFKDSGILSGADIKRLIFFLILSAIYILLPFYSYLLPTQGFMGLPPVASWFAFFFYVVLPLWPLYIARHSGDPQLQRYMHNYINFWLIILLAIAIFWFATNLKATDVISAGGRPELLQATNVMDFLMEKILDILKNLWKMLSPAGTIKNLLNATGIAYYTGTVDQNEKAPVGLYITNVRAQDRVSYVGTPAIVWGDIEGKSFTEVMKINSFCYTDGSGNKRVEGTASPSSFEIFGEEHDSIRCTFDGLQKGTYKAVVGAGFNFETWAYVTYTFVDLELARSMAIEGKNINNELDIPRSTQAVFSNGPVMVGMGTSVDQPVGVDKVKNDRDALIGVTLTNRWSDGSLRGVNEFVLQVPDDFDLVDCDRGKNPEKPMPFETKDGYNYFRFTREDLADPRIEFLTLTCRAHIKDPQKFLSGQQKVQRTFATQVKYDYYIQKSTSLTVKE